MRRIFVAALVITSGPVLCSAQQPAPPRYTSCQPYAVLQRTYDGDYDGALALSQECAEAHLRLVDPRGLVIEPQSSLQPIASASYALEFLCATAQLQAMTGAYVAADRTLSRAEDFEATWPGFRSFMIEMGVSHQVLAATRGFVAERSGHSADAKSAYDRAGEVGASRLAVIALAQGNDGAAGAFAARAAETAAGLAVRGALAELRDDPVAHYYYYESDQKMSQLLDHYATSAALPPGSGPMNVRPAGVSGAGSWTFQPMLLAERARVTRALQRGPIPIQATAMPNADVADQQRAFNAWLERVRSRSTTGLAFAPQYPRFFAGFNRDDREQIGKRKLTPPMGFDTKAVLVVPEALGVTGLLDRDTLAMNFYHLGIQMLTLAERSGVTPATLLATTEPSGLTTPRRELVRELRAALLELQSLHDDLAALPLRTDSGSILTASSELRLKTWTSDASSAHLTNLRPEIANALEVSSGRVKAHLAAAERAWRAE
jgi:hypothetical protein